MNALKLGDITYKLITIRNQNVILDSDIAELYGVETDELNQAIKNNPEKFPEDYAFELDEEEKKEVIKILDNHKIKFSPELPNVFTKKGVYMLATIISGEKAIETTIGMIEIMDKLVELKPTIARIIESAKSTKEVDIAEKTTTISLNWLATIYKQRVTKPEK